MSYLNIQSTFQLQERRKRERDQDQIMEEPPVKKSCQKSDTLVDAKLDYRARHIREVRRNNLSAEDLASSDRWRAVWLLPQLMSRWCEETNAKSSDSLGTSLSTSCMSASAVHAHLIAISIIDRLQAVQSTHTIPVAFLAVVALNIARKFTEAKTSSRHKKISKFARNITGIRNITHKHVNLAESWILNTIKFEVDVSTALVFSEILVDSDTEPYTPEKRQEVQFLLCFFAEAITLLPCSVSWDLSTTGAVIYAMTRHYLGMEIWPQWAEYICDLTWSNGLEDCVSHVQHGLEHLVQMATKADDKDSFSMMVARYVGWQQHDNITISSPLWTLFLSPLLR